MDVIESGHTYAHPGDQGRLGQEVEERLHTVADLAKRIETGDDEHKERRARHLAHCAIRQLSFLAHRKEEVGKLCPPVMKELMMVESIIVDMNSTACRYVEEGEKPSSPVARRGQDVLTLSNSRAEHLAYLDSLVEFIRKRFSGNTAKRWREMARIGTQRSTAAGRGQGFTLVELLIVVLILGILAAIAIPKFSMARENAYVSAVRSDLRTLAAQQSSHQASRQVYAKTLNSLGDLTISDGVNLFINEANKGMGWAATGYHDAMPSRICGIYYGNASASNAAPATLAGTVACKD